MGTMACVKREHGSEIGSKVFFSLTEGLFSTHCFIFLPHSKTHCMSTGRLRQESELFSLFYLSLTNTNRWKFLLGAQSLLQNRLTVYTINY